MDYRSLHIKTVVELRKLAKELKVRLPAGVTKADIIEMLLDASVRRAETEAVAPKADANAAQDIPAAPRKRGRPRKNPLPDASAVSQPAVTAVAPDAFKAFEPAAAAKPSADISGKNTAEKTGAETPVKKPAVSADHVSDNAAASAESVAKNAGNYVKASPKNANYSAKKAAENTAAPVITPSAANAAPAKNTSENIGAHTEGADENTGARMGNSSASTNGFAKKAAERTAAHAKTASSGAAASADNANKISAAPAANANERAGVRSENAGASTYIHADNVHGNAGSRTENTYGRTGYRTENAGENTGSHAENGSTAANSSVENAARPDENDFKSAYPQRAYRAVQPSDGFRHARVYQPRPANQNRERFPARDVRQPGAYAPRNANENPARRTEQFQRSNAENDGMYLRRQFPVQPRVSLRTPAARPVQAQPAAEQTTDAAAPARSCVQPQTMSQTEYNTSNTAVLDMLAAGDCSEGAGVLEIQPDGYGFLRANNYLPGNNDVYISIAQIHRFGLRTGDYVEGKTRPQREGDRYNAMVYINRVNGLAPDQNARRVPFDSLIPVYPNQRIHLGTRANSDLALRIIDMLAPIGKGQRGMIVSQPKAGKTTLLKKIANAITENHPEIHLIVLLIDERPEEVTDMKRSISGEVVYSTFDEAPENHTRVSEMVLERSQRLVEQGKDVVVLLDSITRLARAYNLVIPPTGRSLSGGLDPGALHKPKRFFGAARNIENGGSLTIIATALVDTGSRMDDIIYEEFKGTGNMELHLDRKLSDRRIFPAIDMYKSGTRREELLLTPAELEGEYQARKMLGSSNNQETAEQLIGMMEKTSCNSDFYARIKGWISAFEKDGFSMTGMKR